jgi:hypothetical protein
MSRQHSAFSLASACNAMIEDRQSAWGIQHLAFHNFD